MKAIVIGATGMTGTALVQMLLDKKDVDQVVILVRRPTGKQHEKLQEHVVNFDAPETYRQYLKGDVLFSAMGTTLKTAGSKEAQYKIDYTYQHQAAEMAANNGVKIYVLLSAAGAKPDAAVFYSKMKGELERDVKRLSFQAIHIIKPGMLKGPRKENRVGERIAIPVMEAIGMLPGLRALKPISDVEVASAMYNAASRRVAGVQEYALGEVFKLANGV